MRFWFPSDTNASLFVDELEDDYDDAEVGFLTGDGIVDVSHPDEEGIRQIAAGLGADELSEEE